MQNFETFIARHDIGLVQWLVEQIERNEGVKTVAHYSIEDRWAALMNNTQQSALAA